MTNTSRDNKRREFILNGNIFAVVLRISLPLIMLAVFNYMAGIIDTIVVAKHDNDALSSVVMIDQIKNLFSSLGAGLATGGSIVVARLIGRNQLDTAQKSANTLLTIAVSIAAVLILLLLPLSRPILRMAQLTEDMIDLGIGYFRVQIFTIGITLFNSVFLGLEKARGATVNILVVNLFVMALKIVLTLVFVRIWNGATVMVAAATLIANLSVTSYALFMLLRRNYLFKYSLRNLNLNKAFIRPLVRLSVPVFLGKFVFSMGKVIVNSLAMNYGPDAPGALGVSNHISGSVTGVTNSLEDSSSSVISQNLGAKQLKRTVQAFWCALIINTVIASVGVTLLYAFCSKIAMFFADGNVAKAQLIEKIFRYEGIGIIALGVTAATNGLVYGLGYTKLSMVVNLSRLFVFRIPAMLVMINFFPQLGAESLGIAMFTSNIGIGLMSVGIAIWCIVQVKRNAVKDKI